MLVESVLPRARERLAMIESVAPVRDAATLMARPHVDLLVVREGPAMAGVVTKTDIVGHVSRGLGPGLEDSVRTIMTRDVAHCRPSDPLTDVWSIMKERGFQRVPIVSGMGTPIGVVYTRDVLQGLLREAEVEDKLLLEYISGVGYR